MNRQCKPVFWDPPKVSDPTDVMISDCNYFPGTTFPRADASAITTTVVYTVDVDGLAINRYCKFDVTIAAGACKYHHI